MKQKVSNLASQPVQGFSFCKTQDFTDRSTKTHKITTLSGNTWGKSAVVIGPVPAWREAVPHPPRPRPKPLLSTNHLCFTFLLTVLQSLEYNLKLLSHPSHCFPFQNEINLEKIRSCLI